MSIEFGKGGLGLDSDCRNKWKHKIVKDDVNIA